MVFKKKIIHLWGRWHLHLLCVHNCDAPIRDGRTEIMTFRFLRKRHHPSKWHHCLIQTERLWRPCQSWKKKHWIFLKQPKRFRFLCSMVYKSLWSHKLFKKEFKKLTCQWIIKRRRMKNKVIINICLVFNKLL